MQMVNSAQLAVLASSVVTVGSFDGVHRGHRHLLRTLRRVANRTQLKTTLVTFDPIPRTVVHPEIALPLICSVQTRLRLLRQTGCVDQLRGAFQPPNAESGNRRIHRGQSHAALRNEGSRRGAECRVRTRTRGRRGIPHRIRQTTQFLGGGATAPCSSWAAALFIH